MGTNHPDYVNSLEDMALVNWDAGNLEQASMYYTQAIQRTLDFIEKFFPSMSENEKSKLWFKFYPRINRYYTYVVKTNKPEEIGKMLNLQVSIKGILLSSSSKVRERILNSSDEELIKLYKQWVDQKEELVRIYSYDKKELAEQKINLDSLEKAADEIEKKLSQRVDYFSEGIKAVTITWQMIRDWLSDTESCVEIINYKKYDGLRLDSSLYVAVVFDKNTNYPKVIKPKYSAQLEKKYYNYYINSIRNKTEDKYSYKAFMREIDSVTQKSKIVFFSADGIYNQININTLKNNETNKYIIESKQIIFLANCKEIIDYKKNAAKTSINRTIGIFAHPYYGNLGIVTPLKGTQVEAENIKKIMSPLGYKIVTYYLQQANEENLKSVKNIGILHIATHGYFLKNEDKDGFDYQMAMGIEETKAKENPMLRSGLLLSNCEEALSNPNDKSVKKANNGILTAYEAASLLLDKTSLVVLSACETGLGDVKSGEGVYGLQRAFRIAGADAILMSLWKVNDEATQKLIIEFYRNLASGIEKQKALIEAQKTLMRTFNHPYYWGAFVILGI